MTSPRTQRPERWLARGLLLTASATLMLELLDSRLLSVLTWYHLSFMAVSLAMLGGAGGAVLVYLAGERVHGEAAARFAARAGLLLAVVIPLSHAWVLHTRIPPAEEIGGTAIGALALVTSLLTLPFLLSGVVVTLALTRCGGRVGVLYGSDLVGAAAGCLAIVPLLRFVDVFSAVLVAAALAALGAFALARFAAAGRAGPAGLAAAALAAGALLHLALGSPIGVAYPRGRSIDPDETALQRWNAYSQVRVGRAHEGPPFYWGPGSRPPQTRVNSAMTWIDGSAGTPMTEWDGERSSLDWVQYDVTSLPHQLRSGDAAVIGVGGGRDILAALWGGSRHVTGIEMNQILVDLHRGEYRDFTRIVDHPAVELVHDEARAFLSRNDARYDVLQMSLVDTWAATGAGAFTLTENALYTVEAWKTFLSRLTPDGLFSTSRWFSPDNVSETSRLISLCVTVLLELGIPDPAQHVALVASGRVATLLVSPSPLSAADVAKIRSIAERLSFDLLLAPGQPPSDPRLAAILASRSEEELALATRDPHYEYGAPRDRRPYFFNMLKPGSFYLLPRLPSGDVLFGSGGVIWGNIRATATLVTLFFIALALSVAILFVPLAFWGMPRLHGADFAAALSYFGLIGYGFMSIQIALLQRFSVFLGHPIYTYSVILFTMILFAGLGSFASERVTQRGRWPLLLPLAIAATTLGLERAIGPLTTGAVALPIALRCACVVACTAPLSFLLGFCFPLGLRTVAAFSERATPWLWAANGVSGVLASIVAVAVSMWVGIDANLWIAAALYGLLAVPATRLTARLAQLPSSAA